MDRILLVASEVAPFTDTELGRLVRSLQQALAGTDADVRLMMPRYGSIGDFEYDLHEVIRLSGTEITMTSRTESLTVMVGRLPDTSLQVYFMDHDGYFGRPGRYAEDATPHTDNLERSLFFGRSVLETLAKLRWGPSVIHSIGAMSTLVPHLLRAEYDEHDIFGETTSIYTPEPSQEAFRVASGRAEALDLDFNDSTAEDSDLPSLGMNHAQTVLFPPFQEPPQSDSPQIDADAPGESSAACYENAVTEEFLR
jgi:starch synthase